MEVDAISSWLVGSVLEVGGGGGWGLWWKCVKQGCSRLFVVRLLLVEVIQKTQTRGVR